MIDSHQDELFVEPKRSLAPTILAAVAALVITALVFAGYAFLRKRHAQSTASLASAGESQSAAQKPPKALISVDDALLQGSKTIIAGTVTNTSTEKLDGLSVELELKRRKDGIAEKQSVALEPANLQPNQEGRYSVQLNVQDYGSAKLVALKAGPNLVPVPYTIGPGQKRQPERLESKTITVNKPSSKRDEFLNTKDNPARIP